jgi:HD-GYP domain-containing protein (c-di-GMP phosphodiesterase class II)
MVPTLLSDADFRILFGSAPGLYLVLTSKLQIAWASAEYLHATLTKLEDIVGRDFFDVFPDNPDEPRATGATNIRRSMERVLELRLPDAMPIQKYDIRRPDGSFEERYWSPLNVPVIDDSCEVKWIINRVEDVTEFARAARGKEEQDALARQQEVVVGQLRRANEELAAQRDSIKRHGEALQLALVQTIHAVAATLERRDVYTAGHQRRVADLSKAVGSAMGMDANQLQGLYLGGLVHDLGKIQVPAELLSKPSQLTPLEYELIQVHAQVGYDILKDIKMPWPVALIAYQHHERLDGSGYPNGLKGNDIIIEAQIIAVADVIESMASHRPYRVARGIEAALQEILSHRGTWFNATAVDVCVRLFHAEGFTFV